MAIEQGEKPEQISPSGANGATEPSPRPSLREIAEAAYDEIEAGAESEPGPDDGEDEQREHHAPRQRERDQPDTARDGRDDHDAAKPQDRST